VSARGRSADDEALELDQRRIPFAAESVRHLVLRYGSPLLIIDAERVRAHTGALAPRCRGGGAS